MRQWLIASALVGAVGCIPPPQQANGPTSPLVAPNGSPPPTLVDANMPTSLPPPPTAASLLKPNGTYGTGLTLVGVGGGSIAAGILFAVLGVTVLPCKLGDSACPTVSDYNGEKAASAAFVGVGIAAIAVGVVCLGIGIPLMVVGANEARRQMGYAFIGPEGAGFRF